MAAKRIEDEESLNFEEICDSAMMSILVFDVDSMSLLYFNRLAMETLELNENNLSEFYLERLYPGEGASKARCFAEEFIKDTGFYQDMMMKRMNGINFIANLGVSKLHNGKILLLMFQDVTFQKKLQREVQVKQQELMRSYSEILEQNAELQSLSEAKDKLITLSSHELRTPLSAIIAMTESLSMGVIDDPTELESYHQDINKEAQSLMGILNGMLDVLKLTTKKMPFFIWEHDLKQSIEEVLMHLEDKIENRGIKIETSFGEDTEACFDTIRIIPVITAIIDNALKFSPRESTVEIKTEVVGEVLKLKVRDQGPGIPADSVESIFEEFVTLGDIDTHSKGAGLSLTIAKHTIEQLGGKIYVDQSYEEGCLFVIEIPKKRVLAAEFYEEENPYEDIEF